MDIKFPLACVLLAGGTFGLLMPTGEALGEHADAASAQSAEMQDASRPREKIAAAQNTAASGAGSGWGNGVVLERQHDGHFYADIEIDGYPIRMLVDTGASVVALSADDATALGLQWYDDEVQHVAQGASGPVNGVHTTIDRMYLGEHEATNIRAVIIADDTNISLLGQSFLSTLGSVQITGDRMVLGS